MDNDKEKKQSSQKNWLKEHEGIQVDLLKMKDELIREDDSIPELEDFSAKPETRIYEDVLPPSPGPRTSPPQERRIDAGMTIKQMLGGTEKVEPNRKEKHQATPPRLEEGTIPKSPELTSKIANVLQLEHKLKRRKYEMEKRSSSRGIPPPPKRPEISAAGKIDPEEEESKIDEKAPESSPEKEEMSPDTLKKSKRPEKQIHIPSETPYPKTNKQDNKTEGEVKIDIGEKVEREEKPMDKEEEPLKKKKKGLFSFFSRSK